MQFLRGLLGEAGTEDGVTGLLFTNFSMNHPPDTRLVTGGSMEPLNSLVSPRCNLDQ